MNTILIFRSFCTMYKLAKDEKIIQISTFRTFLTSSFQLRSTSEFEDW